ncbi:6687_t:CDS:2 [Entrophospora sp. SA101]|nr:6687_t:CDS:2 [Entrophospora sp. SA101]
MTNVLRRNLGRCNLREPYRRITTRHQYLIHMGRYFLDNERNNFPQISRVLLGLVIDDLTRIVSGSELLKATVYRNLFNKLTNRANSSNQVSFNERDRAAANAAALNQNNDNDESALLSGGPAF